MRKPADLAFDVRDEATDDPVVTALITTPAGDVFVMADVEAQGEPWF